LSSNGKAFTEVIMELFKTESFYQRWPWESFQAVGFALFEWLDWFSLRQRDFANPAILRPPKPKNPTSPFRASQH
jgi:hypothetical protein